jgi:hypothetical protein
MGDLKRVISGDELLGDRQTQQQQQQEATSNDNNNNNRQNLHRDGNNSSPQEESSEAMLIEPDTEPTTEVYSDHHDAPLELLTGFARGASDAFTANSSLSDASEAGAREETMLLDVDMDDMIGFDASPTPLAGVSSSGPYLNHHPGPYYQQHFHHHQTNNRATETTTMTTNAHHYQQQLSSHPLAVSHDRSLQRMDSAGSRSDDSGSARGTTTQSQSSSRDWGWFEDVHQSGQLTPTLTRRDNSRETSDDNYGNRGSPGRMRKQHHNRRMVARLDPKDGTAPN